MARGVDQVLSTNIARQGAAPTDGMGRYPIIETAFDPDPRACRHRGIDSHPSPLFLHERMPPIQKGEFVKKLGLILPLFGINLTNPDHPLWLVLRSNVGFGCSAACEPLCRRILPLPNLSRQIPLFKVSLGFTFDLRHTARRVLMNLAAIDDVLQRLEGAAPRSSQHAAPLGVKPKALPMLSSSNQ